MSHLSRAPRAWRRVLSLLIPAAALLASTASPRPGTAAATFDWKYTFVDLGSPQAATTAAGINEASEVTGTRTPRHGKSQAFVWKAGTFSFLPGLSSGDSAAFARNGLGQTVGSSVTAQGDRHPVLWNNTTPDGIPLAASDGSAAAYSLNGVGDVVGGAGHAFRWNDGSIRDLGTLGGEHSAALAVNDAGQIAGWSELADGRRHAVLWTLNHPTDLTPDTMDSTAWGINAVGQVVGSYRTAHGFQHAFLWQAGALTDLGALDQSGYPHSEARAINDNGQVVGVSSSTASGGRTVATVWLNQLPFDLNTLVFRQIGWQMTTAGAINSLGEIVGTGRHAGVTTGFLLEPLTPGFHGSWISVGEKCHGLRAVHCQVNGKLQINNPSASSVPATVAHIYLSADDTLDGLDRPIEDRPVAILPGGSSQTLTISYRMPAGFTAQGQHLIALLDASQSIIVSGPIP